MYNFERVVILLFWRLCSQTLQDILCILRNHSGRRERLAGSHHLLALLPKPLSRLHIQALLCHFAFCTVYKVEARHLNKRQINERANIMQVIAQVLSLLFTPSKDLSTAQKIEVCAPACGLFRAGDKIAWDGQWYFPCTCHHQHGCHDYWIAMI